MLPQSLHGLEAALKSLRAQSSFGTRSLGWGSRLFGVSGFRGLRRLKGRGAGRLPQASSLQHLMGFRRRWRSLIVFLLSHLEVCGCLLGSRFPLAPQLRSNLLGTALSSHIYIYMVPPPPSDLPFFALSQVTQLHCKQTRCAI